jgi:hypothetical protein
MYVVLTSGAPAQADAYAAAATGNCLPEPLLVMDAPGTVDGLAIGTAMNMVRTRSSPLLADY